MTMPKYPKRGGTFGQFNRPIRVGEFIAQALSGGGLTYAQALHREYSEFISSIPYRAKDKKGAKRKGMNYSSFRLYLYWARSLGLIEYVNPDGSTPVGTVQGEPSQVPGLADRLYFRMVPGEENSSYWQDLYAAYKESR